MKWFIFKSNILQLFYLDFSISLKTKGCIFARRGVKFYTSGRKFFHRKNLMPQCSKEMNNKLVLFSGCFVIFFVRHVFLTLYIERSSYSKYDKNSLQDFSKIIEAGEKSRKNIEILIEQGLNENSKAEKFEKIKTENIIIAVVLANSTRRESFLNLHRQDGILIHILILISSFLKHF